MSKVTRKEAIKLSRSILDKAEIERIDIAMEEAKRSECSDCQTLRRQRDALKEALETAMPLIEYAFNRGPDYRLAVKVFRCAQAALDAVKGKKCNGK